jgi:DNA-binding PucR family transcriptional regulator
VGARTQIGLFRCSHLEALTMQRTQNPSAASEFITSTLGDFESASPTLQQTLLAFTNEQCNASQD